MNIGCQSCVRKNIMHLVGVMVSYECDGFTCLVHAYQVIINMNRIGISAIFFSYVCNDKKIKELFASTLYGITASVRFVSFIVVVLNSKLIRSIAAHTNKQDSEKRKSPKRAPFFASGNT